MRKTIEALEIEERIQNQLIQQAMDKMMESSPVKKPSKQVKRDVTSFPTKFSSSKILSRKTGISILLILALVVSIVPIAYFVNLSSSPVNQQNWSWSSYNYTLEPNSQYTITVTAKNGYSFDSWAYVTSNHWASTQIFSTQSSLEVSGDTMSLNAYFVPKEQTNQGSIASITLIPTTTIQLNLEVRDGTASIVKS